jgi:TorA maturation chaperone TorD
LSNPSGTKPTISRSSVYRILASAFSLPRPETGSLYEGLLEAHSALQGTEDPPEGMDASESPCFPELAKEHLRLFVGPGHIPCAPYEAVHRKDRPAFERGLVMGPSTAEVRRAYLAAGLDLSETYTDLPDHIVAEMEFMHFLCAEESRFEREGNRQEAAKMKGLQREFHKNHLEPWVPDFADCVLRSTTSPFYEVAANVLKQFTKREAKYLVVTA